MIDSNDGFCFCFFILLLFLPGQHAPGMSPFDSVHIISFYVCYILTPSHKRIVLISLHVALMNK